MRAKASRRNARRSAGRPFGATTPIHCTCGASMPSSLKLGMSAWPLVRPGPLTASRRSVPALMCDSAAASGAQIDSVWAPLAAAESHIKAGTLRLLAVSGPGRTSGHADIPSFRELGIDAPHVQWIGVVAPKGLPADRLAFLRDAFARITKDPSYL